MVRSAKSATGRERKLPHQVVPHARRRAASDAGAGTDVPPAWESAAALGGGQQLRRRSTACTQLHLSRASSPIPAKAGPRFQVTGRTPSTSGASETALQPPLCNAALATLKPGSQELQPTGALAEDAPGAAAWLSAAKQQLQVVFGAEGAALSRGGRLKQVAALVCRGLQARCAEEQQQEVQQDKRQEEGQDEEQHQEEGRKEARSGREGALECHDHYLGGSAGTDGREAGIKAAARRVLCVRRCCLPEIGTSLQTKGMGWEAGIKAAARRALGVREPPCCLPGTGCGRGAKGLSCERGEGEEGEGDEGERSLRRRVACVQRMGNGPRGYSGGACKATVGELGFMEQVRWLRAAWAWLCGNWGWGQ